MTLTSGTSIRTASERESVRSDRIAGIVRRVSVRLMAAPLASLIIQVASPSLGSQPATLVAPGSSALTRRLCRVDLFHRLADSSNLNSRDENTEVGSMPDRFG